MSQTFARRPELVAPAGKKETFFAALAAGADAVYLGLPKFNARLKSENFTLPDLDRLVPFAHERGKKVYVALNTLVKQSELPEAAAYLFALEKLEVDAVILADPGLAALARERFQRLRLHASTQLGVHSSAGAAAAAALGFKRVILARELTSAELALLRSRSGIELEVFVHGALCYSLSGFCLASSFIGGASGNRGLCTQVCRRAFRAGRRDVPFFSPRDLALLDFVPELRRLKIDAFKIEGRLKGSSYVSTVVAAYRRAIDDPASVPEIKRELEADFGRKKTVFFFDQRPGGPIEAIIQDRAEANAAGLYAGEVIEAAGKGLRLGTEAEGAGPVALEAGDSVRIQPASGSEGKRYTLAAVENDGPVTRLRFHLSASARPGDRVFLVERRSRRPRLPDILPAPRPLVLLSRERAQALVESLPLPARRRPAPASLALKFDDPDWLPMAQSLAPEAARLILTLDLETAPAGMEALAALPAAIANKIVIGFPLFISENDLDAYRRLAEGLKARGCKRFWAESVGQLTLFASPGGVAPEVWSGPFLNGLNTPARAALASLGARRFVYSWEDDVLNIRNSRAAPAAVIAYGLVPLFASRIDPGLSEGARLRDRNANGFRASRRHGLFYLLGETPFCLFGKRAKLEALGVREFIIDAGFIRPDERLLQGLLEGYREGKRPLPSTLFNFKRGLA